MTDYVLTQADEYALIHELWKRARAAELTTRKGGALHRIVRGIYTREFIAGHTDDFSHTVAGIFDWDTATISRNETGGLTVDLDGAKGRPIVKALKDLDFIHVVHATI